MQDQMTYYGRTYDSPNPLVRFAHRARLNIALNLLLQIKSNQIKSNQWVLDYGCGDGLYANRLSELLGGDTRIIGYEPYMESLPGNQIEIVRSWSEVKDKQSKLGLASAVTCFETLEHLTEDAQRDALRNMRSLLSGDGVLIVSVPIEGGIPSLVKNLVRRSRYHKSDVYTWRNILRSIFWLPVTEARQGPGYLSHMGFFYRDLEKIIIEYFVIDRRHGSPFRWMGSSLNSQIFYLLRPK